MSMNKVSFNFLKNVNGLNNQLATGHHPNNNIPKYFDKNMHYYICSYGGCGSTVLSEYLSHFGNVYHIHDRNPPKKLKYVGKNKTNEDVYSEWFNKVDIPDTELKNYKVILPY